MQNSPTFRFLTMHKPVTKFFLVVLFPFLAHIAAAATPTESLQVTITGLTDIMGNKDLDSEEKRIQFIEILDQSMDYRASSQRIMAQHWRRTSDTDKQKFMDLFSQIIVNTYFSLLEQYDGEVVEYGRERIQRERYAIVDTQVYVDSKKIPVRYRLLVRGESWKIYDMVIEGVSLIQNYKDSYAPLIRRGGVTELFASLEAELQAASATN